MTTNMRMIGLISASIHSSSYDGLNDNLAVASLWWSATATDHDWMMNDERRRESNHT